MSAALGTLSRQQVPQRVFGPLQATRRELDHGQPVSGLVQLGTEVQCALEVDLGESALADVRQNTPQQTVSAWIVGTNGDGRRQVKEHGVGIGVGMKVRFCFPQMGQRKTGVDLQGCFEDFPCGRVIGAPQQSLTSFEQRLGSDRVRGFGRLQVLGLQARIVQTRRSRAYVPRGRNESGVGMIFGTDTIVGIREGEPQVDDKGRADDAEVNDGSNSPFRRGRAEVEQVQMELATSLLELDEVQAVLKQRVRTPLGVREVSHLAPLAHRGEAIERILATQEARTLLEAGETAPVFGGDEVEAFVGLAEKGFMLEGGQLRAVATTMNAGYELRRHLLPREPDCPRLYGLGVSAPDLSRAAQDIRRCFDPDGQLSDDASPDLGPLRQKVRGLRDSIHDKLNGLLTDPSIEPYLQERYFTIRGDRHVLPVVASYKNHVPGIVHDASGSGQTVYIEPQALIDLGNRLKIAQSEQQEEEARILSRLSHIVAQHGDGVRACCFVLGKVDFLNAAARLSVELDATPILPDVEIGFHLVRARHPLLVLQSVAPLTESEAAAVEDGQPKPVFDKHHPRFHVVANDMGLEEGQQVLVLTGPNTGGKTVAMKTIGLLALMVRCGLHLPCSPESKIGWYVPIVGIIGDQQSIQSKLSTFAAHMKALLNIIQRADKGTLVLIDEIAADTDPLQGQAIAQAVLERIADQGAHLIVTTHFERLKAVPFQDQRFRNAGVGFDERALRPTYKLTLDVPQSSSALDIASGLGLPTPVVSRARDLLGSGTGSLQSLMETVQTRAQELERARNREQEARRELEREKAELIRRQAQLQAEIEKVRERARTELLEEIERARSQARAMVAELQRAAQDQSAADAMRTANRTVDQLRQLQEEQEARHLAPVETASREPLEVVQVGDWVHVSKLGRDGEVVGLDGREAQVAVGTIKMRVPVKSLRAPDGPKPSKSTPPRSAQQKTSRVAETDAPVDVPDEIDLRGQSVEESIERLEAFLDYHYGRQARRIRVIHGHGTGVLREAIREHLRRSGYVRTSRPGEQDEGGDGVTVVQLN